MQMHAHIGTPFVLGFLHTLCQTGALTEAVASGIRRVRALKRDSISELYGLSLAIWDQTVLPATRQSPNIPRLNPSQRPVLDLPTPEG